MEYELNGVEGYNVLEVKADYSKGGINYFNYENEPKGMKVIVSAYNMKVENGFISKSFMVGGGDVGSFKFLLFPMNRNSKKKVAEVNEALKALDGEKVVELFKAKDKAGIVEMVNEVYAA